MDILKNNRELYLNLLYGRTDGHDLCNTIGCRLDCNDCDEEFDEEDFLCNIKKFNNEIFIKYTILHINAFERIENIIYKNTGIRLNYSATHDLDKIFLYCFMPKEEASNLHRKINFHHSKITEDLKDEIMMEEIIDHECARYTKPDKPMSALDMNDKIFHCNKYEKLCNKIGLTERNTKAISNEDFLLMVNSISENELLKWVKKSYEYMSKIR